VDVVFQSVFPKVKLKVQSACRRVAAIAVQDVAVAIGEVPSVVVRHCSADAIPRPPFLMNLSVESFQQKAQHNDFFETSTCIHFGHLHVGHGRVGCTLGLV
jgi:hypothetical protein